MKPTRLVPALGLFGFSVLAGATARGAPEVSPHIAVLLPPARSVFGLQLQITGAEFRAPDADTAARAGANHQGGFSFSYRVAASDARANAAQTAEKYVQFEGLFAPDGTALGISSQEGNRLDSTEVMPFWKSVRAEFEVRNPQLPESATGRFSTHYQVKDLPVPAPDDGETTAKPPPVDLATAQGTHLRLVRLTRSANAFNGGRSFILNASWKPEPPADAPEAMVAMQNVRPRFFDENGREIETKFTPSDFLQTPDYQSGEVMIQAELPAAAKTVTYEFDVVESARAWRKPGAFERVSLVIPVAALWQIAPLQPRVPPLKPVVARNRDFEVSWENMRENLIIPYYYQLHSLLWLRDLAPPNGAEKWRVKDATLRQSEGEFLSLFNAQDFDVPVFHTDNTLQRAGETAIGLRLERNPGRPLPASADITVTAQRARDIAVAHILKDVPLPAPDGTLEFAPDQFYDGTWNLRRVFWQRKPVRAPGGYIEPSLILLFDRDPRVNIGDDLDARLSYDGEELRASDSALNGGDFAEEGHDEDRCWVILELPPPGAKRFSANLIVRQRVWSGEPETLVLPDVPLRWPAGKAAPE